MGWVTRLGWGSRRKKYAFGEGRAAGERVRGEWMQRTEAETFVGVAALPLTLSELISWLRTKEIGRAHV